MVLCKQKSMKNDGEDNVNDDATKGSGESAPMRAAAYVDEAAAVRAYDRVQATLREDDAVVLSVYRLMLPLGDDVRHSVAVVGDVTTLAPAEFVAVVEALNDGAPLVLPAGVREYLAERAGHAARMAPYVEAHHEGGRVVRLREDNSSTRSSRRS
jgi:hypothetical protein